MLEKVQKPSNSELLFTSSVEMGRNKFCVLIGYKSHVKVLENTDLRFCSEQKIFVSLPGV
jgi:hypothetical protein